MLLMENDIVIIDSKTSENNSKIGIVCGYANGEQKDIVRVRVGTPHIQNGRIITMASQKPIQIKETSLAKANVYDILRNMPDVSLDAAMKMSYQDLIKMLDDYLCNRKETPEMIEMIMLEDGQYVPKECCSFTNPATSGGKSMVDDADLPCGADCEKECEKCIIQKIFNEYAALTKQTKEFLLLQRKNGFYGGYIKTEEGYEIVSNFRPGKDDVFSEIKYYADRGYAIRCLDKSEEDAFEKVRDVKC